MKMEIQDFKTKIFFSRPKVKAKTDSRPTPKLLSSKTSCKDYKTGVCENVCVPVRMYVCVYVHVCVCNLTIWTSEVHITFSLRF